MTKVELYTTPICPYCHRAKSLLRKKGVSFTEIDVLLHPGRRKEMTERSGGRTTVPQIFFNGQAMGGCDDLYALEAAGRLDALLRDAAA